MTKIDNKNFILKHDNFQMMTRTFKSIDEHRFINSCLKGLYQRNQLDNKLYYPLDVANYASKQNIGMSKAYDELILLVTKFKETTVQIPLGGSRTYHTSIIYDFITDKNLYTIQVKYNKKIIPLISGTMVKGKFSAYDSRADNTNSSRRYLMAELIQRNTYLIKNHGFVTLQVTDIRTALNIKEGEYAEYKELNRTIIKPALKDMINNLLEPIKVSKGNRISVTFVFTTPYKGD